VIVHDWTLLFIEADWRSGEAQLTVESPAGCCVIKALGLSELWIPRVQPWGASVSINTVDGPSLQPDGRMRLGIEMQSGDQIKIVADSIEMPIAQKS
jgi:hypothetical protein